MAPEIIQMSAFTTASDIWSLGCTIIELINGEPPHYDLAPISALYRIVQDASPPLPRGISPLLVDFLSRCFVRDPDKRATASQLRQHDWLRAEPEALSSAATTTAAAAQRIGQLAVQQLQTIQPGAVAPSQPHEDDSVGSAHGEHFPRSGYDSKANSNSNTQQSREHSNNYSASNHSANHSAN
eukprot:528969-Prymnesium_polylepis.1